MQKPSIEYRTFSLLSDLNAEHRLKLSGPRGVLSVFADGAGADNQVFPEVTHGAA